MGKARGKVNKGDKSQSNGNKANDEKAKKAKKSEVTTKKPKASKRALFDLIENYEEGTDLTKLMDRVIKMVNDDPESVTRRFWRGSFNCDDPPEYEIEGAPENAEGYVSPVHAACYVGLRDALLYLLDHGGDPNDTFVVDCCVVSAVQAAIDGGHLDCVRLLHERGVDIGRSHCTVYGNMANSAVFSDNVDLLKFLTSINVGPVDKDVVKNVERDLSCLALGYIFPKRKVSDLMLAAIQENQAFVKKKTKGT
jgi:hypothetical protein